MGGERTGEYGERVRGGRNETDAWFNVFGPAEEPQVAIKGVVENGVGATMAAPVASKIMDY